jgi:hypothetical protein
MQFLGHATNRLRRRYAVFVAGDQKHRRTNHFNARRLSIG